MTRTHSMRLVAVLAGFSILTELPGGAFVTQAHATGVPATTTVSPSPLPGVRPSAAGSFETLWFPPLPDMYAEMGTAAARASIELAEAQRRDRLRARDRRTAARAERRKLARKRARLWIADHSCPVDRPRRYANDYRPEPFRRIALSARATDIDEEGFTLRGHNGIDIFAPRGTPVRAPFGGWVRRVPNPAGGIALRMYGGGGYLYIAHMQRYAVPGGGRVKRAQIIGYVGNSGNARGMAPHAHIEWHPGSGPAVSPWRFLRARCR